MIYCCGDTHGWLDMVKFSVENFPQQRDLTKEDYVIVLGDFGHIWSNVPDMTESRSMDYFEDKNWTTLFVMGNHENVPRLNKLKKVKMFGSKVGKVSDDVYMLMNGNVYDICGSKIFTFGGANSYDRHLRLEGLDWWPEEIPNFKTMNAGLDNLYKQPDAEPQYVGSIGKVTLKHKVDYVLTHTAPKKVIDMYKEDRMPLTAHMDIEEDPVMKYLAAVDETCSYKKWLFGHWHDDWDSEDGKYSMLYDRVLQIGDPQKG
jgi:hypothetical protein